VAFNYFLHFHQRIGEVDKSVIQALTEDSHYHFRILEKHSNYAYSTPISRMVAMIVRWWDLRWAYQKDFGTWEPEFHSERQVDIFEHLVKYIHPESLESSSDQQLYRELPTEAALAPLFHDLCVESLDYKRDETDPNAALSLLEEAELLLMVFRETGELHGPRDLTRYCAFNCHLFLGTSLHYAYCSGGSYEYPAEFQRQCSGPLSEPVSEEEQGDITAGYTVQTENPTVAKPPAMASFRAKILVAARDHIQVKPVRQEKNPILLLIENMRYRTQDVNEGTAYAINLRLWRSIDRPSRRQLTSTAARWDRSGAVLSLHYSGSQLELNLRQWSLAVKAKLMSLDGLASLDGLSTAVSPRIKVLYQKFDHTQMVDQFGDDASLFDRNDNKNYCEPFITGILGHMKKQTMSANFVNSVADKTETFFEALLDLVFAMSGVPLRAFQAAELKHCTRSGSQNARNYRMHGIHTFITNPISKQGKGDYQCAWLLPHAVSKGLTFGLAVLRPVVINLLEHLDTNRKVLVFSAVKTYIFARYPRINGRIVPAKPTGTVVDNILKSGILPVGAREQRQLITAIIREKMPDLAKPMDISQASLLDFCSQHSRHTGDYSYAPTEISRAIGVSVEVARKCAAIGVAVQKLHDLVDASAADLLEKSDRDGGYDWTLNISRALSVAIKVSFSFYGLEDRASAKNVLSTRPFQFGDS
ncbi:hypothetical protein BT96DRAFT_189232, partial [Gymnopus androsaceus JB14]